MTWYYIFYAFSFLVVFGNVAHKVHVQIHNPNVETYSKENEKSESKAANNAAKSCQSNDYI